MQFDMKVIGAEKLKRGLRKETVTGPLAEGIKKVTLWVEKTVKQSTPVDTGRLRASGTSQVLGSTGKVGTNVQYARFVEYGTKFMQPRHVRQGSAARVFGIGPYTYAMKQLQGKIKEFLGDIGKAIEVKFG